jgi:AcrR family transcriptional regulator
MPEPAYTRLQVDERRRQLLEAGASLFADHAYEEITMQQIARAAGVSKPLLYHYFPSKIDLFKAAVAEHALELQRLIESASGETPIEQLTQTLDAYLGWIEDNARTWSKLIQSAQTLPEAREIVSDFRAGTLSQMAAGLTGRSKPAPALRTALEGWLGYVDAAILDWIEHRDLARDQVRDLLLTAFGATVHGAQQLDPTIELVAAP